MRIVSLAPEASGHEDRRSPRRHLAMKIVSLTLAPEVI